MAIDPEDLPRPWSDPGMDMSATASMKIVDGQEKAPKLSDIFPGCLAGLNTCCLLRALVSFITHPMMTNSK
jgi:hypothetical protein